MKQMLLLWLGMYLVMPVTAQTQNMVLSMPSMQCKQMTEDDQDEVYQLIVWKKSDGTQGSARIPGAPARNRAMSSADKLNNDLDWGTIIAFSLAPGQRIDISGTIMEQDEGTIDEYSNFAKELFRTDFFRVLARNQTPTFQTIPRILNRIKGTFSISNADDWIGTYMCSFIATPGGITKLYRANFNTNDRNEDRLPKQLADSFHTIWKFGGDGALYIPKLVLTLSATAGTGPKL